jgi:hypothetical protein
MANFANSEGCTEPLKKARLGPSVAPNMSTKSKDKIANKIPGSARFRSQRNGILEATASAINPTPRF